MTKNGFDAPSNWQQQYISAYASSHPWEDWAETFAYFLHLEEGLTFARHFGLESNDLNLSLARFSAAALPTSIDNSANADFLADLNRWSRLSVFA